jgi:lysozyme
MQTSIRGIELIKMCEGFRAEAYICPAGKLTIGYGSTENVYPGMVITEYEAEMRLKQHLSGIEMQLNSLGLMINQNQFDALIDFIYNLGFGNFIGSTLRMMIQANPFDPAISAEFMKWVHASGAVLPGLVTRRQLESDLYFS